MGQQQCLAFPRRARRAYSPVCRILIIWPGASIRIGELLHPEKVEDDTSAHTLHHFINCIRGSRSSAEGGVFPPPGPVCAGSEYAPVHTVPGCSLAGRLTHLPVTGGDNHNSGIGSPKVASGPLLREAFGLLPLGLWIFVQAGEGKFLFLKKYLRYKGPGISCSSVSPSLCSSVKFLSQ